MQTNALLNRRSTDFIHSFVAACERRRYIAKACIIAQGETSRELYFLIQGAVTLRLMTPGGRELVLSVAHAGALFGEESLYEDAAISATTVRAKSPCEVARMSYARLRAHPALLAGVLQILVPQQALQLHGLYSKTAEMAFCDTDRRVTSALRELARGPDARPHPDGRAFSVTRTELGAMVGASREVVGRAVTRLQKAGSLRAKGRAMLMLNPPEKLAPASRVQVHSVATGRAAPAPG